MSLRCHTNHIIHHHHHTTVWQQRTQQGRPHAQHVSRRCEARARIAYDTTQQQRSRSTQHSAAQHTGVNTVNPECTTYGRRVESSRVSPRANHRAADHTDLHQRRHPRRRRTDVPYVPVHAQPPSKGSLRGSKCTPLCNSQLPACKPIVCRRSQVSKSYIDAEQRRQRSSISILAVRRRARALSSRSDQ